MATEDFVNDEIFEEEEDPEEDLEEDPKEEPQEEDPEEESQEEEEPKEEELMEEEEVGEEVTEEGDGEGEEEEMGSEEIPEPVEKKRKQGECEVFVGGLHRDATESDIEMVFKKVGEVVEVKLAKDPYSSTKNRGFAFVMFATVEQAQRAVTELKLIVVKGKPCGVIRNKKSLTLHIGNICTSWRKDDLVEYLKAFNLENLEYVHLIVDPRNIGKNRGYAFLDFSTHMDAVAACSKLRRTTVFFGTDVRADITMSKTIGSDDVVMEQVKSVFLDGFPVNWDEAQLREHLKKFGEIESVQLARDMHTAKRKDFGFVSFTTREAVLDCIEKVNKYGIGEGDDKVLVKATLKRPFQKRTPPTLGVRGGYIGKGCGSRGKQSYGFSRSFRGRPSSPYEPMGRGFGERYRARGRLSTRGRGAGFRAEMSTEPSRSSGTGFRAAISSRGRGAGFRDAMAKTSRKFRSRFQRGSSMEIPDTAVPNRSRDPYYESSSSGRLAPVMHHFYSTYSQLTRPCTNDGYDSRRVEDSEAYDYYDLPEYEYDDMPGYEHSYSELDHDMPMPVSRYQPQRRLDRRSGLEMAPNYQEYDYPAYDDEYSRFSPRMSSRVLQGRSTQGGAEGIQGNIMLEGVPPKVISELLSSFL